MCIFLILISYSIYFLYINCSHVALNPLYEVFFIFWQSWYKVLYYLDRVTIFRIFIDFLATCLLASLLCKIVITRYALNTLLFWCEISNIYLTVKIIYTLSQTCTYALLCEKRQSLSNSAHYFNLIIILVITFYRSVSFYMLNVSFENRVYNFFR